MTEDDANAIIMAARAHWFEDEDQDEADAAPEGDAEAADGDTPASA